MKCCVIFKLSIQGGGVYHRNLSLSLAAGNATLWKPSPTTPLSAIAITRIITGVLEHNGFPGAIAGLVCGDKPVGEGLVASSDIDMSKSFISILTSREDVDRLCSIVHRERASRQSRWKERPGPIRQGSS